jgi:hypothetical protein
MMKRVVVVGMVVAVLLAMAVSAFGDPIHVGGGPRLTRAPIHVGGGPGLLSSPIHVGGGPQLMSTPIHVGGGPLAAE